MKQKVAIFKDIATLLRGLKIPPPKNPYFQIHRFEDAPDSQLNETMIFRSNTYVMALITEGEAHYRIGLHNYHMAAGSWYFLGPKHLRYYRRKKKWKGFVCIFTDEFTTRSRLKNHFGDYPFYQLNASQKIQLEDKNLVQIEDLLNRLLDVFEQHQLDHCWHYLHILLNEADRLHRQVHQAPETSTEAQLTIGFNELLELHLYNMVTDQVDVQYSVSDFAKQLFVHPNHLSNTLKKYTGETAGRLIKKRIVLEAKSLLLSTDLSITEIAYTLKFHDTSYFTKFFKSVEGVTPKQFRQGQ